MFVSAQSLHQFICEYRYTGTPVFEFGQGLHYTQFEFKWKTQTASSFDIQHLISTAKSSGSGFLDTANFTSFDLGVSNVGHVMSDYVALLFLASSAGPQPAPAKQLVAYARALNIKPGQTTDVTLPVSLASISRVDDDGNTIIYPGKYTVTLDIANGISQSFTLTGDAAQIIEWPQDT